ncbi:MAG: hypothetical protein HOK60_03855, partial [Planctomycetes bacterium]|nr:hypothetical protein [Planctomycetota bacterium]
MKPFQQRLELLLKKISGRDEVGIDEIISHLPEVKNNKKKLEKVHALLTKIDCRILLSDNKDGDDLDSTEFNVEEA